MDTARLLAFGLRALALLVVMTILWPVVAEPYNAALVSFAGPLTPESTFVSAAGAQIRLGYANGSAPLLVDGLALHGGAVLAAVVVLAAVGIGAQARLVWLLAMVALIFATHVAALALLAHGMTWTGGPFQGDMTGRLPLGAFAAVWGLVPAIIVGAWCYAYWLPRVSTRRDVGKVDEWSPRL